MEAVFNGKCCLVTGAASGMGRATAALFARSGAHVLALDRDLATMQAEFSTLVDQGAKVDLIQYDQSDVESIDDAFARVRELAPKLHACFANAGYGKYGPVLDVTPRDWQRHVDINLTGTFLVAQQAARIMRDGGEPGSIVLNASTGATTPTALFSAYCASKGGLVTLGRILAAELGPFRIRVNVLMPGTIATQMTEGILASGKVKEALEADTPLGEVGRPEDIAEAVAFLCSDQSRYVNGTTLVVDGGQTVNGQPRWFRTDYTRPDSGWWLNADGSRATR